MSGEGVFFCVKFWAECVTLTTHSTVDTHDRVTRDSSAVTEQGWLAWSPKLRLADEWFTRKRERP